MEDIATVTREGGLRRDLGKGQVIMISLGGAIGTTLFLSSGVALGYAGPSVLVSYAIAGFIAVVMVFSLSEMAVMHPAAGSFGTYAETYLNPWAGFVARYTYWFAQVIATGFEAVFPLDPPLVDPALGLAERARVEGAGAHPAELLRPHQARRLEHAEVLHGRRQGHRQRAGQVAHRRRPAAQPLHHRPPCGVGEGVEQAIEAGRLVNHILKYQLADS